MRLLSLLRSDHSAWAEECVEPSIGSMSAIINSAAGMVINPSRRLPHRAEIIPVSHGSTDPPNPQMASTQRESDVRLVLAKNRANNRGKIGASAAPSTNIAAPWLTDPGNPTRRAAASTAVITAQ